MSDKSIWCLRTSVAGIAMVVLSGCADIEYLYNIPDEQSDCPVDTIYRSGGTAIRDRTGGTNIRDRDGNTVGDFCEMQVCPDGNTIPTGDPEIVWHLEDHEIVVAMGFCPP